MYIQSISMYLAPPIVSVFLLGVCWRRANAPGAIAAFGVGYLLGFGRMLGEITCKLFPPDPGSVAEALFVRLNYLYVGTLLCAVCIVTQAVVTCLTKPPSSSQVEGLTVQYSDICGAFCGRCCEPPAKPATRMIGVEAVGVQMGSTAEATAANDVAPAAVQGPVEAQAAPSRQRLRPHAWWLSCLDAVNTVLSVVLMGVIISLAAVYM